MEFWAGERFPPARRYWAAGLLNVCPIYMQCFVKKPEGVNKGLDFDRKLYIAPPHF
jgi:glutamate synthase (ferredoxin)